MTANDIGLRMARADDLVAINQVIGAAVMTWNLPERVKRLTTASFHYNALDLDHLHIEVAEDAEGRIVGVAAWEQAEAKDAPESHTSLLLHGLYVHPDHFHQGIGSLLFRAALRATCETSYDGLLIKAQEDAVGFFAAQGMQPLPVKNPARDFPRRFWTPC